MEYDDWNGKANWELDEDSELEDLEMEQIMSNNNYELVLNESFRRKAIRSAMQDLLKLGVSFDQAIDITANLIRKGRESKILNSAYGKK